MTFLNDNQEAMQQVLRDARTIAVVGHSDKPHRTSYQIAQFLRNTGYDVYPVNPTVATIDGETSYPSLQAVPVAIDIVNVFRRSVFVSDIVTEAIEINAGAIWTQLGVIDYDAAQRALDAGLHVAMNLCIKVELARLGIPRVG